jgi:hypothetical protein
MSKHHTDERESTPTTSKTYHKPRFVEYGAIAEMTMSGKDFGMSETVSATYVSTIPN